VRRPAYRALALGVVLAACNGETPPAAARTAGATFDRELVVLPNNTAVYARTNRLVAVRREGDILWDAVLPSNDTIIAPVAVALNSLAFVRGGRALHAVSPDGKWAWSKPLDGQSQAKTPATNAPVTFPDSTVAVVVGDDIVHFDEKGGLRWRVSLPDGHVVAALKAGMDGALFVPTTAGLYCLGADGSVSWMRAIGN